MGPDLYRVGGISQALSGKKTKGNAGAGKLSVLFSSGISSEPLFVPVAAVRPSNIRVCIKCLVNSSPDGALVV